MTDRIQSGELRVAPSLYRFIAEEALPAAGISLTGTEFWAGVAQIVAELTPVNRRLLRRRDDLQAAIDSWHQANGGQPHDLPAYRAFLEEIGYLVPDPGPFQVGTEGVDPEIATGGGPATGGSRDQRQVRDQRGQRALGVAVRRVLRHRRATGNRRGSREGRLQPGPRPAGDRGRPRLPRPGGAAGRRVAPRRDRLFRHGRRPHRAARRPAGTLKDTAAFAGYAATRARRASCCAITACTSARHRPRRPDRQERPGRGPGRAGRGRRHHYRRLRGLGRGGGRRGQGRRVPQLARPQHRRAERADGEERPVLHPPARARPRLQRRARQAVHPARPGAAAGAERRPPDDHRRRSSTPTGRRSPRASSTPSSPPSPRCPGSAPARRTATQDRSSNRQAQAARARRRWRSPSRSSAGWRNSSGSRRTRSRSA